MELKKILFNIFCIGWGLLLNGCNANSELDVPKEEVTIPSIQFLTDTSLDLISKTEWVEGKVSINNEEDVIVKLKGRGNSSWRMPKKCYTIKFDEKISLFGMNKSKKWVLVSNYADKSLLRNKFAYDLGKQVFDNLVWTPSFNFCDVTFNSEYLGSYIVGEKIEIGKERLKFQNIAEVEKCLESEKEEKIIDENQDSIIDLYDGGFVIEINVHLDEIRNFITSRGVKISLKDPDDISEITWNHIKTLIQLAEDELYSETAYDILKYYDINSFVDWYIINEFAKNIDADFYTSVYMFFEPHDGKFHMGPIWDFDYGFGNVNARECDNPIGWYINQTSDHSDCNYFIRLFEIEKFRDALRNRWNQKRDDLYDSINNNVLKLSQEIKESADRNFDRWKILGIKSWQDAEGYENRTTWEDEVAYFMDFCNKRYEWMDSAINEL